VAQTPDDHLFGPISALVIALVAFFSVKHAHQAIRRRVYLENHVKTLNQSLAKLQQELEQRGHVAEHLAVILNDLRTKIDYYEQQAEAHKLPRYTETAQTN
jgi:seryl-tRNA(Sec) selenium transferase